jgi:hypothetical protein
MGLQGDEGGLEGETDPATHDRHDDCNYGGVSVIPE